jgi:hypothetical protein
MVNHGQPWSTTPPGHLQGVDSATN